MAFDVKITTVFNILDLVAPFACRGCGRLGEPLCECCKNYNIRRRVRICPRCRMTCEVERMNLGMKDNQKLCQCAVPVFAVSYREGLMAQLVEDYKYKSERKSAGVLAQMMGDVIPSFDEKVVVVPLPTIAKHIRERGFDHTRLLGKKLARRRCFELKEILVRRNKTVQVGASAEKRCEQAKRAYGLAKGVKIEPDKRYLLVDDVWTTGASMEAAIKELQNAGVRKMAAAVILVPRTDKEDGKNDRWNV